MQTADPHSEPQLLRRRVLRLLAATPLLGACGGPSALRQAGLQPVPAEGMPAALPAPALRVGDEWRYVVRDAMTGLVTDRVEHRVVAVDADGYTLAGGGALGRGAGRPPRHRVDFSQGRMEHNNSVTELVSFNVGD